MTDQEIQHLAHEIVRQQKLKKYQDQLANLVAQGLPLEDAKWMFEIRCRR